MVCHRQETEELQARRTRESLEDESLWFSSASLHGECRRMSLSGLPALSDLGGSFLRNHRSSVRQRENTQQMTQVEARRM